jgi:hypothetical protein
VKIRQRVDESSNRLVSAQDLWGSGLPQILSMKGALWRVLVREQTAILRSFFPEDLCFVFVFV